MATTHEGRIGKTRWKLAALLMEAIPGSYFEPHRLNSQYPAWASAQGGACSWYGDGLLSDGRGVHVYSWDTMTDCVRYGIEIVKSDLRDYEISVREAK
jgi:hypothetical protein